MNSSSDLAKVFKKAARPGVLEKDFRQDVEAHLLELAQERGIDLAPHTEVTLGSSGRADTIYNRFIIEWEKPGSLKASNTHTKNRETIAQCQRYGDSLFWRTRERAGRIVGCCTDGLGPCFILVTRADDRWEAPGPIPINEISFRRSENHSRKAVLTVLLALAQKHLFP